MGFLGSKVERWVKILKLIGGMFGRLGLVDLMAYCMANINAGRAPHTESKASWPTLAKIKNQALFQIKAGMLLGAMATAKSAGKHMIKKRKK